eukprot:749217-Hanusia_phi.AAC.2
MFAAKAARIKQARDEAAEEINKYRQQLEMEYQKVQSSVRRLLLPPFASPRSLSSAVLTLDPGDDNLGQVCSLEPGNRSSAHGNPQER